MKKRIYIDPPDRDRCEWWEARVGRSNERNRCGRRKKIGGYCQQHHDMAEARVKAGMKAIERATVE